MMNLRKIILGVSVIALPLQQTTVKPIDFSGLAPLGKKVLLGMVVATGAWVAKIYSEKPREIRRKWPTNDELKKQLNPELFDENFKWGIATSGLQSEGNVGPDGPVENNMTRWIKHTQNNPKPEKRWQNMGSASDFWSNYKNQLPLVKEKLGAGMKTFRFSIPMSKIQKPNGDVWKEGVDHYVDVVKQTKNNGLEPLVTLFHHEWSTKFDDANHFLKEENVKEYVEAYKPVIKALHDEGVTRWMPLNEPAGYAMGALVDGRYPPGKKLDFKNAKKFTKNILDAHGKIYDYIVELDKKKYGKKVSEIGIAHAIVPIHPYNRWLPWDYYIANMFDYLTNDVTLEYFKTGKFVWPLGSEENPAIKGKIDFIGVNYYSHAVIGNFKQKNRSGEGYVFAENGKEVYAEGFEEAINKAYKYSKDMSDPETGETRTIPIYITENAVNAEGDVRETAILRHFLVLREAKEKGIEIKGYDWWSGSIKDPYYNWASGFTSQHNHLDKDSNLREGSGVFTNYIDEWYNNNKSRFAK